MARPINIPRLGWTMEEGTFGGWLKADGEPVRAGEELFVLESDKANEPVQALDEGVLRIAPGGPKAGDGVRVGQVIGYLVAEGEALPAEAPAPTPAPQEQSSLPAGESAPPLPGGRPGRRGVSPRARRAARELGVDTSGLAGSGRGGRVVERDVRAAAVRSGRVVLLSPLRKRIAQRMLASAQGTAAVTLTTKADATRLRALRVRWKAAGEPPVPSYTALFVKLSAQALGQHPLLNASWAEDRIVLHGEVHVGVAVDTDAGLVVPVVRNVPARGVADVAREIEDLAEKGRAGRLRAEDVQGGTFTVTNLGGFGVDAFTPLLNPPQCAVLGVGRVVQEPAVHEGQVVPRDVVTLSLTFDHRAVDGAPAARFLDALRRLVEAPEACLGGPADG